MKKNKTYRAATDAGLNKYGWGNGGNRKRPKGVGAPMGGWNIKLNQFYPVLYTPERRKSSHE